ncbi:MAG: SdpI family protein [Acidimicrobiia bacterium]|nr:SdpI family protein [Acidimicrobiia bacterium]MBT8248554.1 SdpI family protein [Acidimicrobiia bacterium]NNL14865.1 SdpI family protein [Acidimicrobiia bacterium]
MFRNGGAGDPMPGGAALGLGLLLVAAGVGLFVAGRRAQEGRLRQNHFVGIRTTLTLNSEIAWDAAHLAGGRRLMLSGYGPVGSGILLFSQPTNGVGAAIVLVGLGWMVGWILAAAALGERAAKAALDDAGD